MTHQIIFANFETYNTCELPTIKTSPKIDEGGCLVPKVSKGRIVHSPTCVEGGFHVPKVP